MNHSADSYRQDSTPTTLWHVCPTARVDAILAGGLLPRTELKAAPLWDIEKGMWVCPDRVYLYAGIERAEEYIEHVMDKGRADACTIIEVDGSALDWDRLTIDHETLASRLVICSSALSWYVDDQAWRELKEFRAMLDLDDGFHFGDPYIPQVGQSIDQLSERTLHQLRNVAVAGAFDKRVMYQGSIDPASLSLVQVAAAV